MSPSLAPLLTLHSVGVDIESAPLLSDISLEILPGQVTAVVGPNGAGKSTLIKAIAGEQTLSAGEIMFAGQSLLGWPTRERAKRMAVLPQRSLLNFGFTGREVVALARTPHDTGLQKDTRIVNEVLGYLDASYLADRLYTQMSGGEQQRIQLARVLAQIWRADAEPDPSGRLLLLDEPSSYFDLAHQQLLVQLVRKLASQGIAVMVVLHDLNMAMGCADQIAVLCGGRLQRCGPAKDVLDQDCIQSAFGVQAQFIADQETGQKHIALGYPSQGEM